MRTWVDSPPGCTFDPGGLIGGAISARASPGNANKTTASRKVYKKRILRLMSYLSPCTGIWWRKYPNNVHAVLGLMVLDIDNRHFWHATDLANYRRNRQNVQ